MDDHDTPMPAQTVADNLMSLRRVGVTDDGVAGCQSLVSLVFGSELQSLKQIPSGVREPLVQKIREIVKCVAKDARRRAYETRVYGEPREKSESQTAAAGELLSLTDEYFDRLLKADGSLAKKWHNFVGKHHSPARRRQFRAGIWLGGQTDRTARNQDNVDKWFAAFASAINDYLDVENRRAELREFAINHLEGAKLDNVAVDVATPAVPDPLVPSPATSIPPQQAPPVSNIAESARTGKDLDHDGPAPSLEAFLQGLPTFSDVLKTTRDFLIGKEFKYIPERLRHEVKPGEGKGLAMGLGLGFLLSSIVLLVALKLAGVISN